MQANTRSILFTFFLVGFSSFSVAEQAIDKTLLNNKAENTQTNADATDKIAEEAVKLTPEELLIKQYESLHADINRAEISLKENLNNMIGKTGDGLSALELRQFQKAQDLIHLYMKIIDNLVQQKELSVDLSDQAKPVKKNLLIVNTRIVNAINRENEKFEKRIHNLPENSNKFILKLKSHHEYQGTALDALVEFNKNLTKLDLHDEKTLGILHKHLLDNAERLAGKIQIISANKKLLTGNLTNPEASSKESIILHQRFDIIEGSLKKIIKLMSAEGMETANYQRILIESTGTITKDILDLQVASGLIKDWTIKVKDIIKESGIEFIFKIILFSLILFIAWLISKLIGALLHRSLNRSGSRKNNLMQDMVVGLTTRFVFILGFLFALSQMGISLGPVLTGLGIAGFIIGFALQDTLGNFASGIMILIYRPYDVGDIVEVGSSVFGSVSSMNLVSTTIMTFDNQTLVLPNSKIWGDVIKNITNQEQRRIDLVFHAPLNADLDQVLTLLTACVASNKNILLLPEPTIKLHAISFNSLEFIVRSWVKTSDYWPVYWDLQEAVKRGFDKEGIPFPIQQSHVVLENPKS